MNPKTGEILQSFPLCDFKNRDPHYIFLPTLISLRDWAVMPAFDLRGETFKKGA